MREKPIVIKVPWLPFGRGVTLYPFIIVEGKYKAVVGDPVENIDKL